MHERRLNFSLTILETSKWLNKLTFDFQFILKRFELIFQWYFNLRNILKSRKTIQKKEKTNAFVEYLNFGNDAFFEGARFFTQRSGLKAAFIHPSRRNSSSSLGQCSSDFFSLTVLLHF